MFLVRLLLFEKLGTIHIHQGIANLIINFMLSENQQASLIYINDLQFSLPRSVYFQHIATTADVIS